MKGAILAAFVLVSLATASLADCYSAYSSCSRQCCDSIGGDFSEDDDGTVFCDYGPNSVEYYACDHTCVIQELDCLAPGSGCSADYQACSNICGRPGGNSCNRQCSETAFNCVSEHGSPISGNAECCGAFILLFGGSMLALFARKG